MTSPFTWAPRMTRTRKENWLAILWVLRLDGDIVDAPNAVEVLRHRLSLRGVEVPGLAQTLLDMDSPKYGPLIDRQVKGRRTSAIRLAVDELPPNPFPPPATVPDVEEPTPEGPAQNPADRVMRSSAVDALLAIAELAYEAIDHVLADAPVDDLIAGRLARALEDSERYRRDAEAASSKLAAAEARNGALKRENAILERNLAAKLRSDDSGRRELDKLVRSAPRGR